MFDLQPKLKGDLMELRPLRAEDFESLFAVASDPLIWEQHPSPDRYKADVFQRFFDKALASKGALVAVDLFSQKLIGSSRYYDYASEAGEVAIGYTFLARNAWGSGHNRQMKKLMLDHAFQFVERVLFHIGEKNLRSGRAVEKIGAQAFSRIEKDSETAEGPQGVSIVYGIQKQDWLR